jgi:hypothetical protein
MIHCAICGLGLWHSIENSDVLVVEFQSEGHIIFWQSCPNIVAVNHAQVLLGSC